MTMSCLHTLQAAPRRHHQQRHVANAPFLSHFGEHLTKVEDSKPQPHCVGYSMSSMAVAANPPWKTFCSSSGRARIARTEMQVECSWGASVSSGNAEHGLRGDVPAAHIFLTSFGKQGAGRRAAVAMFCSAQAIQMVSNRNSRSATWSRDSAIALRGGWLLDFNVLRGGAAAIKGSETEAEGHKEMTHEEGRIRPASRQLGRRSALLLGGSVLWQGLGCCRICAEALAEQDWDYAGPCGPAKWKGMCTSGSKQSPVNITASNIKDGGSLGVLNFVYVPSPVSVKNTGHGTIQVSFGKPNNFLKVRGHTLQLLQFHFHSPSEHAFDGERYPMEAHLVHRDPVTRKLVVVGVMLDASKNALPNKCLAASLTYVPQEHGLSMDAPIQVSPRFLLPPSAKNGSRGYVHYGGSLTTPPCSEGVEWFVLDKPLKISSSQVLDFIRFSGDGHTLAFNSTFTVFGQPQDLQGTLSSIWAKDGHAIVLLERKGFARQLLNDIVYNWISDQHR